MRQRPTFEQLLAASAPPPQLAKRPAVSLTTSPQFNLFNETAAGAQMMQQSKAHTSHQALEQEMKNASQEQGAPLVSLRVAQDLGAEQRKKSNESARIIMEEEQGRQRMANVIDFVKKAWNTVLGSKKDQDIQQTAQMIQPTKHVVHDVFYDAIDDYDDPELIIAQSNRETQLARNVLVDPEIHRPRNTLPYPPLMLENQQLQLMPPQPALPPPGLPALPAPLQMLAIQDQPYSESARAFGLNVELPKAKAKPKSKTPVPPGVDVKKAKTFIGINDSSSRPLTYSQYLDAARNQSA